jgi:hypothetical protein
LDPSCLFSGSNVPCGEEGKGRRMGIDKKDFMKDGEKLRLVAEWFDRYDENTGNFGSEVQEDLRRIAEKLERLECLLN